MSLDAIDMVKKLTFSENLNLNGLTKLVKSFIYQKDFSEVFLCSYSKFGHFFAY